LSGEAEKWAWEQRWCGGRQKLVLLAIARFARGWTYHGNAERIAAELQLDVQAVQRAVRRLLETSYVTRPKLGTLRLVHDASKMTFGELITGAVESKIDASKMTFPELETPPEGSLNNPPNPSPAPSKPPTSVGQTTESKDSPLWLEDLYRLGRAQANPLKEREVERIGKDFGDIDLRDEMEKFVSYWSRNKPQGGWVTYLRIRTWLRNTRDSAEEREKRIARANGSNRGIPDDQDAYLKVLDWNKRRLSG
jgi:hypothetical protein